MLDFTTDMDTRDDLVDDENDLFGSQNNSDQLPGKSTPAPAEKAAATNPPHRVDRKSVV